MRPLKLNKPKRSVPPLHQLVIDEISRDQKGFTFDRKPRFLGE